MEKLEIAIYYNTESEDYRAATADTQELERRGIEVQRRTWFNGDYVEAIEAKIDKLETENKRLSKLAHNAEAFATFYGETCDDEEDERFVSWWLSELKPLKSEGRDGEV